MVGDDLSQLVLDVVGIGSLTAQAAEGFDGLINFAAFDKVPGAFWQPCDTTEEDEGPEYLYRDGNAVGAAVGPVFGSVVHAGG